MSVLELLKSDPELQGLLRQSLREKAAEEKDLIQCQEEFYKHNNYYGPSVDRAGIYFLEQVFKHLTDEGVRLDGVRKDIKRMRWLKDFTDTRDESKEKWLMAYDKAMNLVNILDVVRHYQGEINERRNIKCPFHKDGTASLHIYVSTNSFHCFGCNADGKPVNFVMLKDGMSDLMYRYFLKRHVHVGAVLILGSPL
jgi:hypothetical protein